MGTHDLRQKHLACCLQTIDFTGARSFNATRTKGKSFKDLPFFVFPLRPGRHSLLWLTFSTLNFKPIFAKNKNQPCSRSQPLCIRTPKNGIRERCRNYSIAPSLWGTPSSSICLWTVFASSRLVLPLVGIKTEVIRKHEDTV